MTRSKLFRFKLLFLQMCIYVNANIAYSQQLTGVIAESLGGAGVVSAETTESHLINPAVLPHSKSLSYGTFYRSGDFTDTRDETTFAVSAVDNSGGVLIPGGFTYSSTSKSFPGYTALREEFIQLSVGQFVWNQLSLGASVLTLSQDIVGGEDYRQWDLNLGVMWNPQPDFAIGLSYLYFMQPPTDLPEALILPKTWVLGGSYILTQFARFRLDVAHPEQASGATKFVFKAGLESFINSFFVTRFGYQRDENNDIDAVSLGLGFVGPRFELSYSLKKKTSGGSSGVHGFDLRVPL